MRQITFRLFSGPGPGVESISGAGIQPGSREDLYLQVRAIASRYPNPAILDLLSILERRMMAGPPQGITRTSRITDRKQTAANVKAATNSGTAKSIPTAKSMPLAVKKLVAGPDDRGVVGKADDAMTKALANERST